MNDFNQSLALLATPASPATFDKPPARKVIRQLNLYSSVQNVNINSTVTFKPESIYIKKWTIKVRVPKLIREVSDLLYPLGFRFFRGRAESAQLVQKFTNFLCSRATLVKWSLHCRLARWRGELVEIKSDELLIGLKIFDTDPEPSKTQSLTKCRKWKNPTVLKKSVVIESPKRQVRRSKRVAEHKPKEQPAENFEEESSEKKEEDKSWEDNIWYQKNCEWQNWWRKPRAAVQVSVQRIWQQPRLVAGARSDERNWAKKRCWFWSIVLQTKTPSSIKLNHPE